jgi:hypothetical protein
MAKLLTMAFVLLFALFIFSPAHADLINNGNNLIYDTDLNITWYNPNVGNMTWDQANIWITSLNTLQIGGVTGWRLPTALNADGSYPTYGFNVTGSELGHLYYDGLGNAAHSSLINTDPFSNLQSVNYWTSTTTARSALNAFVFSFITGEQGHADKNLMTYYSAMAVYSGNVTAVSNTPVPSAILLLGPGLVSILVMKRKFIDHKKARSG